MTDGERVLLAASTQTYIHLKLWATDCRWCGYATLQVTCQKVQHDSKLPACFLLPVCPWWHSKHRKTLVGQTNNDIYTLTSICGKKEKTAGAESACRNQMKYQTISQHMVQKGKTTHRTTAQGSNKKLKQGCRKIQDECVRENPNALDTEPWTKICISF